MILGIADFELPLKANLLSIFCRNERLYEFYSTCYLKKNLPYGSWPNIWGQMENLWKVTALADPQNLVIIMF